MTAILAQAHTQPPALPGGDDVRQFLQEIRRYPLLTPEEERLLARQCAQGDQEAIRRMVNSNLRLVVSVAREYAGRGVPLLDLIQEGSIGLLAAARKYDYTLEFRFSTYATKWIRQGIRRCLVNHSGLIRLPEYTAQRVRKVEQARSELVQSTGVPPTVEQISRKTGISMDKVEELLRISPEICSLDTPTGEDEDSTLGGLLEDVRTPQPQEELVRRELEQLLSALLATLPQRQQEVLRLHFGMAGGDCHSLEDISKRLGISKERVRQIEKQAMERLQKEGAGLGLEDFLE